jgi:amino acid adenylation domain-containing protein/thioester reductase-like protein/non-ribosomal peptide synthase protein (TIGR01720 family)
MKKMNENRPKYYPLTHAQKRVYYDIKKYPDACWANIGFLVKYKKQLDFNLITKAINKAVYKNEGIRMRIVEFDYDPQPSQYVSDYKEISLDYIDFSGSDSERHMREWVKRVTQKPVELIDSGLFYFAYIKYNENESGYYMKFLHTVSDGWSCLLLLAEINQIYEALATGKPIDETPNPSYIQYISDEQEYLTSEKLKKDKDFWHKTLLPLPHSVNLSHKRGNPFNIKADDIVLTIPDKLRTMMHEYRKTHKTSLFKLVLSALSIYVSRFTGLNDIVIGSVNHGRCKDIHKNILGMFVSTLSYRINIDGRMPFNCFLEKVGKDVNYIIKNHQQYPFDRLATELKKISGKDAGYLRNISLIGHGDIKNEKFDFEYIFPGYEPGALLIHINISNKDKDGILELEWIYQVEQFSEFEIRGFHQGLVNILNDALTHPGKRISEINLLSPDEIKQILYDFNNTEAEYPPDKTIHQLFEVQVEKTPANRALEFKGEELTYRQLNEKANQLARILREKGVKPGHIVGLMAHPSLEMMAGILAILKAGGAYLPIAPPHPTDRIDQQLEECKARLWLNTGKPFMVEDIDVEIMDLHDPSLYGGETKNLEIVNSPDDPAYIIHAPLSAGNPTVMMMGHASIIDTSMAFQGKYPVEETDVCLLKTPPLFNASMPELLGWFLGGGSLWIAGQDEDNDIGIILNQIASQKITHIHFAPTSFNQMVNLLLSDPGNITKISTLKYVFLSGETIVPETINRFSRLKVAPEIVNLYRPNGIPVYAAAYSLSQWKGSESIPIGTPMDNVKIYILKFFDGQGKEARAELVPVGVPGELCISGPCLPGVDLKKPGFTGENFPDNPFAGEGGSSRWYKKVYRTGDLARWLPGGNIQYLGRMAQQVKIKSTRIEIERIEDRLLKQERVKEAVVVARTDNKGEIYLCTYIVSDEMLDTSVLRDTLAEHLPAIMIPTYIVPMERIPLRPGGQADRDELQGPRHDPQPIKEKLAEIEAEALHVSIEQIDLDYRFLELAGHAYTPAQVISMLQRAFHVRISMAELFRRPTLRQLSEYLTGIIREKYRLIQPVEAREYYPQSSAQKRLYFLQQMEKDSTVYNIWMMDIYRKGIEKEYLEEAFKKLLRRHESLRTSFHVLDGAALQKINDFEEVAANFEIKYYETTGEGLIYSCKAGNRGNIVGEHFTGVIKDFVKPFDLSQAPLLRVGFIKVGEYLEILMLDIHLIVSDFISLKILEKELWELYDRKELPSLRLGYKDFSQWLNREGRKEDRKELEAFWLKEFPGEIPLINLPVDYPRPAMMSFEGDTLEFEIGEEETGQLKKIAEKHGETLYIVLLSLYNVLLAKLSGQEDIVVGIITADRVHENLQDIVGMFANTLALRNYPGGGKNFDDFLVEVRVNTFAALENQDYPFEQLVSQVAPRQEMNRNPLFDAAFELEYETDPTGYLLEAIKTVEPKPYDFGTRNSKFDMTLVCAAVEDGLECAIEYSSKLFKKETIERFIKYFKKIASSVCRDINQEIGEIEIISGEEKTQILYEFNNTKAVYAKDKTIHQLFDEQVEKNPDNCAVIFDDSRLSYRKFNDRVNQLAWVLRKKGIKPDHIAAVVVERSLEMMIGIFAVHKAGGAYLPIEPNYPRQRIDYLLKDSGTKIMLGLKKFLDTAKAVDFNGELIDLEQESLYQGHRDNPVMVNKPGDIAYIIYTSGSTGKPKGVMIEHFSVINRLNWMQKRYPIGPQDVILQKTTYVFDVSVWELFWWSFWGASLCLLIPGGEKDPAAIIQAIEKNNISTMHFVPSMLNVFLGYIEGNDALKKRTSLKQVFASGEALTPYQVEKFNQLVYRRTGKAVLINLYGPTEATVDVSFFDCPFASTPAGIPIGKPVDNTHLIVVNNRIGLQPVKIAGELCISGDQLARGYLNRPILTAEKFIANPYGKPGNFGPMYERLYRTGDLAHWLPDGNIEYLGRIDFQVKVRGFRIELGEIESQLLNIENIKEAVVLAKEDNKGEKYLCAYFVASEAVDVSLTRKTLSKSMPDYMVPSYFVQLDKIPLTPNGKLDRKALPEPELKGTAEYAAPTNEIEEILTGTWSDVLGSEKISIDDNFFEIGGDSIKAIQIASKLQKHRLKMEVNQVFLHKTIRQLAKYLKPLDEVKTGLPEQGVVKGKVELTPIQKWLFTGHLSHCHHFNQSVTLYRKAGFNETYIKKVFTRILEHHDALRMKFKFEDDPHAVVQEIQGIKGKFFDLEVIPIDREKNETLVIKRESSRIHSSIDLQTGPLVKLGLFKGTAGDHLLIVIHHLVVDGVCWRILLEDFETGYQQAARGKEIIFRQKTASYKLWSQKLKEYAQSKTLLKELPYWQEVEETEVKPLPVDHVISKEERKFKFQDMVAMMLPEEKTRQLLTKVNRAYHTEINDILLAALGLAIKQWIGLDKVRINLEGHGREMIIENMDITRTVGWFTTQYPVRLDMEKADDLSFYTRNVKEILRAIPNKGIGYGILKYLTPIQKREPLGFKPAPEILFNYLGKFGGESFKVIDQLAGITDLSVEAYSHPEMEMEAKIDIEGVIDGEKLKLLVIYNKKEYKRETIEKFAEILGINLEKVIDHCRLKEETIHTPSDFGYKNLSLENLERMTHYIKTKISPRMEIQSIYPLSPMQSGLYFHWLKDEGVNAYLDQMELLLEGEIEKSWLEESLNYLIDRYDVFRTVISYEGLEEPVQMVLKKRKAKLHDEDISHLNKDKQVKYIKELRRRDRDRGFDITRDQLVRFFLVKTGSNEYRLIWSFHHIIMDGWCLPIIREELRTTYRTLKKGEPLELEPVTPYVEYINWLKNQDNEEGLCYWEKYLEDYEEPAALPKLDRKIKTGGYKHEEYHITIEVELMQGLEKMAGKSQVTINTIVQTLWGVLLQKYNNRDDVVYGTIVSGRPAEIPGIERIVGLFINMIPLRIKSRGEKEFSRLLKEVQENSLASRKYEYLAAADIQARSTLKGDLIDHLFIFENYPVPDATTEQYPGYIETGIEYFEQTHYNFNIIVIPWENLQVNFSYNALVYDSILIENIAGHFENVIKQIVNNPGIGVKEIEIITAPERHKILFDFNKSEAVYSKDKTIHELFTWQVRKIPAHTAVVFHDKHLSYQELEKKANQLAGLLREKGVGPDKIVGIMVSRSLAMMVALLSVLKAGGAYVPIDPEYPIDRIKFYLQDSSANVLLTQQDIINKFKESKTEAETIDVFNENIYDDNRIQPVNLASPADLAYVVFTSGSTGKPKGVMIRHRNAVNFFKGMTDKINFSPGKAILALTTVSFDIFLLETLLPLTIGLKVVVADEMQQKNPELLKEAITKNKIKLLQATPSRLKLLLITRSDYDGLKEIEYLLVGGEPFPGDLFVNLQENFQGKIIDVYGPTETTVWSTLKDLTNEKEITIGVPIANTQVYILDKLMILQPIGVVGELYIGGDGVARGYLNRPALTSEMFIEFEVKVKVEEGESPREQFPGKHMSYMSHMSYIYKTGDLARWLPNGEIECMGRADHQVKVRGFRIETGEIENHIIGQQEQKIKEAVVMAREDTSGEKYLCAYIVSSEKVDITGLEKTLSRTLLDYMIPSYFVQIEKIPLTPNGKIDRKKLPDPQIKVRGKSYAAPRNEIEDKLAGTWSQLLHIKKDIIGIDDDFFKLGGHSLKAAVMITMIHKHFSAKVKMHEIFNMSTIRKLAGFITKAKEHVYSSIPLAEEKEYYPQTSPQKRLFFVDQLENAGIVYNMQLMDVYCKGIEKEALEEAVRKLIKRHESLRTSFFTLEGEAVQKIHPFAQVGADFAVEYYEMSEDEIFSPGKQGKGFVRGKHIHFKDLKELTEHFVRPFDLTRPPLLRLGLIKIWGNTKILMLDTHHIVSDGVSLVVFLNDLWELYDGEELPALNIQYKDFSHWTRHDKQKAAVKKQEKYWLRVFDGEIAVLNLPYDKPRPSRVTFNGNMLHFEVGREYTQKLNAMAREHGATLYMILFAAYNVLLAKLSGQEEIVVGTVTAGRDHADLQKLIGMFVDTLALRSFPGGNKTFKEFLGEVRENILAAFENQDYPFEELVGKVSSRGDVSRNPVFDVLFSLDNEAERTDIYLLEALMVDKSNPFSTRKAKFDISLIGAETGEELHFNLEYNINLFKEETIERFIKNFKTILASITGDICKPLLEIDIIPHDEQAMILYMFNDTEAEYPKDQTVHEWFERQASKRSSNIAVVGHDLETDCEISLGYKELNKRANQLGRLLRDKGLKPDCLAAIMVEPSVQMIVGMLAVLKAGGGFLPIDHKIPGDRIKYMLEDSGIRLFISRLQLVKDIAGDSEIIPMENAGIYSGRSGNLESVNKPADLAYVIYTSGSTGKPKGVMVEHCSLVNLCFWHNDTFSVTSTDRATKYAGFGFDASIWEVFPYLVIGARVYIVPEAIKLDVKALNRYFEDNGITASFLPTQMCEQFFTVNNKTLRLLLTGGDKLKSFVKRRYQLYNNYGPTENTVVATSFPVKEFNRNIPIGKPIANNQVYILDRNRNLLPIGVPGELCVGGDSMARGYMNNPRLTYQKFIENPYPPPLPLMQSPRLYCTGDLARWLDDGNIEFLGRIDYQVKVRGYRIELGEIENQLMHQEDIEDVVVIAREDSSGQKYLCAYLVSGKTLDIVSLKKKLSKNLPEYMIPAYFIQLEQIPLNPNGKIDRGRLPGPQIVVAAEYAAPRNETEKILAEVWSEVLGLGIEKVSIDDNFFEIGGDSIKSILMSGRLRKRQFTINVNDFFSNPTIRQAAAYVQKIQRKIDQGVVEGMVELTPIQKWFFEKEFKEKHHFNHFVWLYSSKRLDKKLVKKVFTRIIEHHDALRMVVDTTDHQVVQENRGLEPGKLFDLKVIDFRDKKDADFDEYIERINRSIHLKTGPLVKLGLFKTTTGDHLLVVIHHLVVDGVSWKVLLEDFETGYEQAERGDDIKFPHKTDSFRYWAYRLKQYAHSPQLLKELDYWKKIEETKIETLPKDHPVPKKKKIFRHREVVSLHLDRKETGKLLEEVDFTYNMEATEILLTALGMAVNEWSGNEKVSIDLGRHRREPILEDIDTKRTVGWFTRQYPLLLDMKPLPGKPATQEEQLAYQIRQVKETMRRVPNKGLGYGILKYLTLPGEKENVTFKLQPEIRFNYYGKLSAGKDEIHKRFQVNFGYSSSPKYNMEYAIDIMGVVDSEGLKLSIIYNKYEYEKSTVKKLADCWKSSLIKIIDHCTARKKEIIALDMSALDYQIKKDYEKYLQQIRQEKYPDFMLPHDYRHILLTGATGYMGAYLLAGLLEKTAARLYLPVRGATREESCQRFQSKMAFYFGRDFYKTNQDRLEVLRSDLSEDRLGIEPSQYEKLCKTVDAVVHSAANVKHYGVYEEFFKDNVIGTENVLEFALAGKNKDFHFISTLSTGSGDIPGKEYLVFTEYSHDQGQETNHLYIKSKFEAEQRVLAYRAKGLNASIYRAGNLTFHSETGEFQENIENNAFYAIMKGVIKVGFFSENMKKIGFDMSFINHAARAVVLLLTRKGLANETYHIGNPHRLTMKRMTEFLKAVGIEIPDVEKEKLEEHLAQLTGNDEYEKIIQRVKLDSWAWDEKPATLTVTKNDRTIMLLKELGFQWPKVTKKHIEKMIAHCRKVGFL